MPYVHDLGQLVDGDFDGAAYDAGYAERVRRTIY